MAIRTLGWGRPRAKRESQTSTLFPGSTNRYSGALVPSPPPPFTTKNTASTLVCDKIPRACQAMNKDRQGYFTSRPGSKPDFREVESIAEVDPIRIQFNSPIYSRDDIGRVVEYPLVTACQIFYDKGIQTIGSAASEDDLDENGRGNAYIYLRWEGLSEENRAIAVELFEPTARLITAYDNKRYLELRIPIAEDSYVRDVEKAACELANTFADQSGNFTTRSMEELRAAAHYTPIEDLVEEYGFTYDKLEKLFYYNLYQWMKNHPLDQPDPDHVDTLESRSDHMNAPWEEYDPK